MSALAYDDVVRALVLIFQNAPSLEDVKHVTDEPHDPTEMQCPAILVDFGGFSRVARRLVGNIRSASPYDESPRFEASVWWFSAESAADARRRRDDLARRVMDVIADDYTLGGRVTIAEVLDGDCRVLSGGGGVFAKATLRITCLAFT